ncbi:hypothetical protein HQ395_20445 [Aeromonas hydrophila]|uniref:hypothetical protein n=1 Tax=Aeromonas hydrophila TaxID=644 RepID=UPI001C04B287|nr:hypothetical protein [Aeromonas hydrophila]QWL80936.1 hypothetical protein HQ395_20445 [Aeromonas hydrophila]
MTDESTKKFHFEVCDAIAHGVEGAVFLSNIRFWLRKNIEAQSNIHDGRVWTFNSSRAFAEIFPFWNERKIARITAALEASGILLSANYNRKQYDRTKWFSINEPEFVTSANDDSGNGSVGESESCGGEEMKIGPKPAPEAICQKWEMDLSKTVNAFTESVRPIPDVISSVITDVTEELHGNFAGKIASASTADSKDDDSSKAEGHESKDGLAEKNSKEGLPLPDELGDDYPLCKQAIKIMNRLRREEGFTNIDIYTNRMRTRQWQECEYALASIFNDRANAEHMEQHFFDMLAGPLAKKKRVTLNHLCATFMNYSNFDHLHLLVDCHGFDNDGYAY